ncbi:MAG: hypothetical protein QF831_00265, partial [Candidatus Thalassarchaeaceae archaeon]|nr:hypothetical protein [Candidatus Thalassarchaeaceae archaeon]
GDAKSDGTNGRFSPLILMSTPESSPIVAINKFDMSMQSSSTEMSTSLSMERRWRPIAFSNSCGSS